MLQNRLHKSLQTSDHTSRVSLLKGILTVSMPYRLDVPVGWRVNALLIAGWECHYLGIER